MSGMFSKSEISSLKGNITRLFNSSVITKAEAAQLRDLITINPLRARYMLKEYSHKNH